MQTPNEIGTIDPLQPPASTEKCDTDTAFYEGETETFAVLRFPGSARLSSQSYAGTWGSLLRTIGILMITLEGLYQ
jgi:hypothetical protein